MRLCANHRTARFELSGLRLDRIVQQLTDSCFRPEMGRNGRPATGVGAHTWRTMAKAETNRERENARNVGQLRTCGNGYAVNNMQGNRCGERIWLLR
jgi:hypothetical protein